MDSVVSGREEQAWGRRAAQGDNFTNGEFRGDRALVSFAVTIPDGRHLLLCQLKLCPLQNEGEVTCWCLPDKGTEVMKLRGQMTLSFREVIPCLQHHRSYDNWQVRPPLASLSPGV